MPKIQNKATASEVLAAIRRARAIIEDPSHYDPITTRLADGDLCAYTDSDVQRWDMHSALAATTRLHETRDGFWGAVQSGVGREVARARAVVAPEARFLDHAQALAVLDEAAEHLMEGQ